MTLYFTLKINNLEKKNIEKFTVDNEEDTKTDIKTSIKKIYLADIESIRKLSDFAIDIFQDNIIISEDVIITGKVNINNINSLGDINTTGNIDVSGNINTSGYILGNKNLNITGTTTIIDNIITNKNITINNTINTLDNIIANKNISANGNTTVNDNINSNNIIVNDNPADKTNGIINCNEIVCDKIGGGASVGAWLINKERGIFPIYSSINNYSDYGMDKIDDMYIVMPGFSIIIYLDPGFLYPIITMNNINTTKAQMYRLPNIDRGQSCKLYYGTTLYNHIAPINVTKVIIN